MPRNESPLSPAAAILRAFAIHNRIHSYLIDALDNSVWDAPRPSGKGRSIAALFAHMHSVRLMWLKAAKQELPAALDKSATHAATKAALDQSADAISSWVLAALESDGRIPNFKPDAWSFIGYLISHESHHRGQVVLLARELGSPVDQAVNFGLWAWGTR
jgi:uncharacterized damage-inducible protein DinB